MGGLFKIGGTMKKIKLIVFDVDGLMLNTEWLWQDAWREVAKRNDCPEFARVHDLIVGVNGSDIDKILNENLSFLPKDKVKKMLDEAHIIGMDNIKYKLKPTPYLPEIVEDLKSKGFKLAVATATNRDLTMERLGRMDLLNNFDYVLCGDEVTKRKPDPEIYLKVAKHFDLDPSSIMVLEDTGYGVQAAYRAGANVIMVPSINPPTSIEKEMAFALVKNLDEARILIEQTVLKEDF